MKKFNSKEFTAPFDLERYKAGEPVYLKNSPNLFRIFKEEQDGKLFSTCNNFIRILEAFSCYAMRPPWEAGWIKHDGSECPIPWAKEGCGSTNRRSCDDEDCGESNGGEMMPFTDLQKLEIANATISKLRIEVANDEAEMVKLHEELKKLQTFKEYVHGRLDIFGVPLDPDPRRTQETGCRIEGRLGWLFWELSACVDGLRAALHAKRYPKELED